MLEESTNKPIADVIVVTRWMRTAPGIGHANSYCAHVETATTDAEGRFELPKWRGEVPHLIDIYKSGYERAADIPWNQAAKHNKYLLKPFRGGKGERLQYLRNLIGMECGSHNDYVKKIIPLYKGLYEEAKTIAVTPEDKKIVKTLHYSIDVLELGSKEADKKLTEGVYDK